jgi:hypothetical protein
MRMWSAMGVRNPSDVEIDELIAGLRAGNVTVPAADAHLR